jgi:hypothetical protein
MKRLVHSALRASCVAIALFGVVAVKAHAQCGIKPLKSLFIIDPSVVDDPVRTTCFPGVVVPPPGCPVYPSTPANGAWTFQRIITNMSGSTAPSKFAEDWLTTFLSPQTVNGQTVFDSDKAIQVKQLLNSWRAASGGGKLDLCIAPFRLTAIVNRMDLANIMGGGYGGPIIDSAGEGRFIFNILDPFGNQTLGNVIFEFNLPARSCDELRAWAKRWAELSSMDFGPCFNEALQSITDDFIGMNVMPSRPNGSALNQCRTNEIFFNGPWELREWNIVLQNPLDNMSGLLRNVTTKQTPANGPFPSTDFNGTTFLGDYINSDQAAILNGSHVVPEDVLGVDFLGGQAVQFPIIWDAPNIDNSSGQQVELRHRFALQTCQGCHFFETGTFLPPDAGGPSTPFVHVTGRNPGQAADLSGFLTGITNVPDPVDPSTTHKFDEFTRRANLLCKILELNCDEIGVELDVVFAGIIDEQTSSVH